MVIPYPPLRPYFPPPAGAFRFCHMIDKPMLSVSIGEEGAMSRSVNSLVEVADRVKDRMGHLDPRVWFERIPPFKAKKPELVVVRP